MSSWQCLDTQSCETLLFLASFSICICWCRSSASWRRRAISSTASLFLNHWVWDVDGVESTIEISDSQENVKETKNLILDDLFHATTIEDLPRTVSYSSKQNTMDSLQIVFCECIQCIQSALSSIQLLDLNYMNQFWSAWHSGGWHAFLRYKILHTPMYPHNQYDLGLTHTNQPHSMTFHHNFRDCWPVTFFHPIQKPAPWSFLAPRLCSLCPLLTLKIHVSWGKP